MTISVSSSADSKFAHNSQAGEFLGSADSHSAAIPEIAVGLTWSGADSDRRPCNIARGNSDLGLTSFTKTLASLPALEATGAVPSTTPYRNAAPDSTSKKVAQ